MDARQAWTIVAAEYPPQFGGLADYTYQIAEGLAAAGDDVEVLAPRIGRDEVGGRARVRRLAHGFTPRGLPEFRAVLRSRPKPRRILVQYTAQAFGLRAVNLPFALTLRFANVGSPLGIMFHEYAIEHDAETSFPHQLQAFGTRLVARTLARRADRIFVSTQAWVRRAHADAPDAIVDVLPVPSNLPVEIPDAEAAAIRGPICPTGHVLLGHFGRYRMADTRAMLRALLPELLARHERLTVLLIGDKSDGFAADLRSAFPAYAPRVHAYGGADPRALAAQIAACDVLVQPYGEGATTRRGSLIAGLALGVPTVTTVGVLSEPLWHHTAAVATAPAGDVARIVERTQGLLSDTIAREHMASEARALYDEHFKLDRTIGRLRDLW